MQVNLGHLWPKAIYKTMIDVAISLKAVAISDCFWPASILQVYLS